MAQTGIDFSVYIDERTRDSTGREWVFEALDRWLAEPDAPRYFILTGEPGIGKTAIAARLTQIRDPAAVHFCIARRADTLDPLNFTRSISQQLTRYDGFAQGILEEQGIHVDVRIDIRENYGQVIGVQVENLIVEAPSAAVAFNRAVLDPLKKLYDGGYDRQLTILVDALDEAAQHVGPETIVDLLANVGHLPAQLRFVLTSHLEEAVLRHFEQLSTLHQVLDAGRAENQKDVRDYICLRLEASAALRARLADDGIGHPAFIEQVATASEGNFLYLVWTLRAVADGTQPLAELGTLPQGLDGIYREFLRTRVLGRDIRLWRTYFRPLLGALAAAQSPITAEQLARFSGMERQDVADGVMDVGQFLEPSSSAEGRYQLYHQSMVDFLGIQERSGEFWIDLPAIHSRIADSYWQSHYPDWQQCDSYGLDSLAAHLFEGGEFGRLHSLIDQGWMATRFQRSGCTYNGFLRDAGLAWRAAGRQNAADRHAGRPLTALALLVRCGLLRASLASLTYHMPPELLAQAVTAGLWPARRALDLVARVPDLAQCARAYSLLLQTGCLDEVQETEARQGLEAARATDGARPGDAPPAAPQTGGDAAQTGREAGVPGSTEALGDALAAVLADPESDFVFPGLSSRTREQLAQALETTLVPSESDLSSRVALRIRLGLPPVDLGTTSDHRREWEYMLAQALALAFDPRLADEFTSTVLHRALAMRFREPRELALRALASYVDGELLQPALEAVLKVEDEECRSEMLGLLAGRLQGELLVRALQAVQSIAGDEWARLEALLALAEHLDGTDREKVLGLGLQLAQGMPLGTPGRACSPRVEALAALAPLLPKAQRKETLEEALAAAKGLATAPSGP
ncbi:MAG: ATP-binding protein, partial [Gammaproteobacteria bacterium]